MKHDLTTGTWQDGTGCPISIVLLLPGLIAPVLLVPHLLVIVEGVFERLVGFKIVGGVCFPYSSLF